MRKPIMIVDDSEDTRELFTAALEAEGFSVIGAKDGDEALKLLSERSDFSLILLDLSMPGMNGVQLLEEMEKRGVGRGIPVMLVSAADNLRSIKTTGNVIDTLKKPFFYPELIFKIREEHKLGPSGPI
ncbi:MAG: response regulator [Bdellovibrionales bacterium]